MKKSLFIILLSVCCQSAMMAQEISAAAQKFMDRAEMAMELVKEPKDYQKVIDELNKVLAEVPNHPSIIYNLGICYAGMGVVDVNHYKKALEYYRQFLKLNPNEEDRKDVVSRINKAEYAIEESAKNQGKVKEEDIPEGVSIYGVTWATTNVGATTPDDYGKLCTWDEAKNLCPTGWRLPTEEEFNSLGKWTWDKINRVSGIYCGIGNNRIFLPAAGYRDAKNGTLKDINTTGIYWSSTQVESSDANYLYFNSDRAGVYNGNGKTPCFSARCVKESIEEIKIKEELKALQNESYKEEKSYKSVLIDGVTWATTNVGATTPEDYGKYFTWEKAKNVCPTGWRLPTEKEFIDLKNLNTSAGNLNGVKGRYFGSGDSRIFLPAAGGRKKDGTLYSIGTEGLYWSSTEVNMGSWYNDNGSYASNLNFDNNSAYFRSTVTTYWFPVRCVKIENRVESGVKINGVTWATRNVDDPGTFTAKPQYIGKEYTLEEAKNVCPTGWRLPTKEELESLKKSETYIWSELNGVRGGYFGSGDKIFLPAAKYDANNKCFAIYWSGTMSNDSNKYDGYQMIFYDEGVWMNNNRGWNSVRCVKE